MERPPVKSLMNRLLERGLYHELRAICRSHGVTLGAVLRGKRTQTVVVARRAICVHLSKERRFSSTETGAALGMNHTSVLSALRWKEKSDGGV